MVVLDAGAAAIMRANKRTGQHVILLARGDVHADSRRQLRGGRRRDRRPRPTRRDTTITGAGAGVTIIDAAGIDRVFDLSGKRNITFKDILTIRGGDAESVDFDGRVGGGIRVGRINDGRATSSSSASSSRTIFPTAPAAACS